MLTMSLICSVHILLVQHVAGMSRASTKAMLESCGKHVLPLLCIRQRFRALKLEDSGLLQ